MRPYSGNGFTLEVPDDWVDLTIHTFVGPSGEDPAPWARAVLDPDVGNSTLEAYADRGIRAASQAAPGFRLLRRQAFRLSEGSPAIRAEARWFPTDEHRFYQRMVYVLWHGTGIALSSHLTKKTRRTQGPIVDRLMESVRPRAAAPSGAPAVPAPPSPRGQVHRVVTDRFTVELPEGWEDKTVHMLSERDDSRFRRNLVVTRERMAKEPDPLADFARGEAEGLSASVPDFEPLQESPVGTRDGKPAHRIAFRRSVASGGGVLQFHQVAWRAGVLYRMNLTLEDAITDRDREAMLAVLGSFRSSAPAQQP